MAKLDSIGEYAYYMYLTDLYIVSKSRMTFREFKAGYEAVTFGSVGPIAS